MRRLAWLVAIVAAVTALIRQRAPVFPCCLTGHQGMLHVGQGEVYLRCANCLRRTSGWRA